jgi:hypothetical protein
VSGPVELGLALVKRLKSAVLLEKLGGYRLLIASPLSDGVEADPSA